MLLLRLLILCFSIFGYVLFFHKQQRIKLAFAPAMSVSFIMLGVFLSGLLGVLEWGVCLLLLLGVALLIWMLLKKTPTGWKKLLTNPALIFLTLSGVLLFLRFQNRVLYSYDDFSHWGTIVKSMLINNSFPSSANSFLIFQSYPPGSACWIYFVSRILGAKEGFYLFANAMLTLAYLSTLFAFFGKRRWYHLILPLTGAILLYTNVLDPNSLGVDAMLAAAGLASVLTIYRYRDEVLARAWLILPMICATILIKNSGIFFSLLSMALFLFYLSEQKSERRGAKWAAALAVAIVPIAVLLLWRWHVSASFLSGFATKHAMSTQNFLSLWSANRGRSLEMLQLILLWIINPVSNHTILVLGGFAALAGLEALLRRNKEANQRNITLILVLVLCTLLYEIGIAGMYLFSMPYAEFFYQNGQDYIRYNSTFVGFLCGILIAYCGVKLSDKSAASALAFNWVLRLGTLALMLICLLPNTKLGQIMPSYRTELETKIETLHHTIEEANVPLGGSYYVKASSSDVDFASHLFRYQLYSSDVTMTTIAVDSAEIGEVVSFYTAYINWDTMRVYTYDTFEG
jgi:hypothetical protein